MSTETPPAVSDAMREAVAPYIALFDVAYRKACEGSMQPDWCNAALLGQQMRNAFFKAIGPDGPIASEIARLTGERDAARETNRDLHRRLQAVEGPLQSRIAHLTQGVEFWKKQRMKKGVRAVAEYRRAEAAEAETARLRAENRRLSETYTDEDGTVWSPPTAWAYFAACRALHTKTAALAEAEARGRRQGLEWQPIETAPTHHVDVLLWDGARVWQGCGFTGEHDEQRWIETWDSREIDATHWAPMPAEPSLATAPAETQKPEEPA